MYIKTVTIINKSGLHARPATEFVGVASKFKSKIMIKKVGEANEANAKSIVILLTMAICKGCQVELKAEGEDEKEAVDTLAALIEKGFGEV